MQFKHAVPIQLTHADIPHILNGRPDETNPKRNQFSFYFTPSRIEQAYIKVGYTPATWAGMLSKGVMVNLAGTTSAKSLESTYEEHIKAAVQCHAEGYTVGYMVEPPPVFKTTEESSLTFVQ